MERVVIIRRIRIFEVDNNFDDKYHKIINKKLAFQVLDITQKPSFFVIKERLIIIKIKSEKILVFAPADNN